MRKSTRGRNVQHVVASPAREVETKVPNKRNKSGFKIVTRVIKAIKKGYVIKHEPNRPSQAMIAGKSSDKPAAYVNWKECEGAKRRKWS